MRLVIAIIVMFLSVLALTGQTTTDSSQPRTVTEAEIDKLEGDAYTKLKDLSYRRKSTEPTFRDAEEHVLWSTTIVILEVGRPNRLREIFEVIDKSTTGGYPIETIKIGRKTYFRRASGPWEILNLDMVRNPDREVEQRSKLEPPKGVAVTNEYLYLGEQTLNGFISDVYQLTTKETIPLGSAEYIRDDIKVKKIWFDKKGRFLKIQNDSFETYKGGPNSKTFGKHHEVIEYEYDIPINIEAPIK